MSKSGFSTLNRWLGRKNKDKSAVNGKLSKSSTNLSISSTNINETSQLEYNRITPLPAATTNAPFEQTFRITVLLPKDQLYVTRLGARVPLSKLLELVCDNKLLDQEKYEFRNPVDPSQVYSCDLTIGAVGLSEIRLCHKTESYDHFNSDEIIKLHRTSLIRESLSSSEFSSRNSKHTTKTTSPYSSTNSLNSMDSSAVSCGRPAKLLLTTASAPKISAPPRKKRVAPRPPSHKAIPEKSSVIMENGQVAEEQESTLTTKDFSISTTNLTSSTLLQGDINGNLEDANDGSSGNGSLNSHGYAEDTVLYAQVQKKNAFNLQNPSKLDGQEMNTKLPEPSPRKRIVLVKKKTVAPPAPAPTPRNSLYQDDVVSIASTNVSSNSTPSTPKSPNVSFGDHQPSNEEGKAPNNTIPKPVPRITTSSTLLNATDIEQDLKHMTSDSEETKAKPNISKVMLNRTPTPEPRSLSCEPPETENCYEAQLGEFQQPNTEEDCVSKQADSGIGEPVPSPLPDSLPTQVSTLDVKAHFESSSDDDDMVKVYNFKLGKTLVKPVSETKTLEELTIMNSAQELEEEEENIDTNTPPILTQVTTPNTLSETSSWNFAIPISPPPNFADNKFLETIPTDPPQPDTPITPKITERPILNFENLKPNAQGDFIEIPTERPSQIAGTPLNNIVDELSSIIQDKGVESLIKKTEDPQEIEAAKPNTLSNFSINTLAQSTTTKSKEVLVQNSFRESQATEMSFAKASSPLSSESSSTEEEKLYRKRSNVVASFKQRRSIARSDSFHTTAALNESGPSLSKRTFSQLSLDQMAGNLNRRRSSSELSIAESPSLQSLEIIKNILNSRKNSLANSSGEEDKEIKVFSTRRHSEELKFASLELKTCKNLQKTTEHVNAVANQQATENMDEPTEKPKELPKVYRYSGPPSINFSTWNERPKSQVAIKNEGDYIFGGAKDNKNLNNYRLSVMPVAAKSAFLQRKSMPDKVLVKPHLQQVLNEEMPPTPNEVTRSTEINSTKNLQLQTSRPTVASVLRPQSQIIVNCNTNTVVRNIQRPTVESVPRPQSQSTVNISSFSRDNKPRLLTSTAPATIGPQLLRSSSIKQQQQESERSTVPGPQILRSSSVKKQEIENSSKPIMQTPNVPFGQSTLRRTGFKEKILAKEEKGDTHRAINIQTLPTRPSTNVPQKFVANGDLLFKRPNQHFNNATASAKLHLNLNNVNSIATTKTTASPSTSATASIILETSNFKPKIITPTTAPPNYVPHTFMLNNISPMYCTPPSPPPPPPSSLPIMSVKLKPVNPVGASLMPPKTDDPRDELLTAIRNFNREDLKKA